MSSVAVLWKLAVPAAQKAGSLIFQKIARLRRVYDAINGDVPDEIAAKAVSDFEIVKGTWKGEFTESLNRFLRSLEASGLIQAMFNNCLVHNRSPAIKEAFLVLFQTETGQSKASGDALYEQITSAFETSAQHLTKDPVLARMVRSSHQSLANSIIAVESSLETIRSGMLGRPGPNEHTEVIPRILRAVANDTKTIRVETSQGRKDVEISKIYIAPRLKFRNAAELRPVIASAIEHERSDKAGVKSALITGQDRDRAERSLMSVAFPEIRTIHRCVVLGNPGGGKSTLLQSVCQGVAVDSLKALADGALSTEIVVPIRIVLRDYEHARIISPQLTLLEYLVNDLLSSAYYDKTILTSIIEGLLATGRAYLAFDGLDEILKTANRRIFVDLVNRFVRQYPLCQVLITSRLVGYGNAPMPADEYDELILDDFADEDVEQYAEKFIKHVGKKKAGEAREAARKFVAQTSQNASDLRRNPLMLGLMMWIFNIRDDVPSNRPEIYQECSRLMFERWDGDRNILVDLPQTFDRLQVFAYLASRVFEDEDLAAGVSAKWIEAETKSHLCEVLESPPQAQAAATALVQFIVDRSWVMSEKGEGVFAFTHQTFLEYFFAKFLDDKFDTVADLMCALMPHVRLNEWDVVARLAIQIKTDRNRRRQDETIDFLDSALSAGDLSDEESVAVAGFAVRCLEFLSGSEPKIRALVSSILDTSNSVSSRDVDPMDAVAHIFSGARDRRPFIADVAERWFHDRFEAGTDEDRDFVIAAIDGIVGKFGQMGAPQRRSRSIPAEYAHRMRGRIMPLLVGEIRKSPKSAKTLFEWTGTLPQAALRSFGPEFIHYARPSSTIDIDGLSALALLSGGGYTDMFQRKSFNRAKAIASLAVFGAYWRVSGIKGLTPFQRVDHLNNPPVSIWISLLRLVNAPIDAKLGLSIACYLESENFGSYVRDPEDATQIVIRMRALAKSVGRSDAAAMEIISELASRISNLMDARMAEELSA